MSRKERWEGKLKFFLDVSHLWNVFFSVFILFSGGFFYRKVLLSSLQHHECSGSICTCIISTCDRLWFIDSLPLFFWVNGIILHESNLLLVRPRSGGEWTVEARGPEIQGLEGWRGDCQGWDKHESKKHMGVSENRGTPKSSILIGFSIINHPFWVVFPLFL